ncbi:MAG: hypothetical protein RLY70_686 [Planctomycetota bacterium]
MRMAGAEAGVRRIGDGESSGKWLLLDSFGCGRWCIAGKSAWTEEYGSIARHWLRDKRTLIHWVIGSLVHWFARSGHTLVYPMPKKLQWILAIFKPRWQWGNTISQSGRAAYAAPLNVLPNDEATLTPNDGRHRVGAGDVPFNHRFGHPLRCIAWFATFAADSHGRKAERSSQLTTKLPRSYHEVTTKHTKV